MNFVANQPVMGSDHVMIRLTLSSYPGKVFEMKGMWAEGCSGDTFSQP
jgi:hypothetical protein